MKKHFKVLTGIFAGVIAAVVLVTAGAYANEKGWFNFTGQEQAAESENQVDEIMKILRDTHDGKISAENALSELEALNPAGLAKKNKELRDQVEQLKKDNGILTTDLNAKQTEVNNKQAEIDEKNAAYDQLQQERDAISSEKDEAIAKRDEIQALLDAKNQGYTQLQEELTLANEYIEHLEGQLTQANAAVNNLNDSTTEAVEEARTYKE